MDNKNTWREALRRPDTWLSFGWYAAVWYAQHIKIISIAQYWILWCVPLGVALFHVFRFSVFALFSKMAIFLLRRGYPMLGDMVWNLGLLFIIDIHLAYLRASKK